ncbi:protein mono-ADP-ribosyltransferase PARP12-like [Dreissena polymorpha]|nr:protein mono-ADP-ribosyltransferase PARP12-like [Dreissena polymorpha]
MHSPADTPALDASSDWFPCDFCSTCPNEGDFWKCNNCVDHYICTSCYTSINLFSLSDRCSFKKIVFSTRYTSPSGIRPDLTTKGCGSRPIFGGPHEEIIGSKKEMSSSVKPISKSSKAVKEISQISNVFTPEQREQTDQSVRLLCVHTVYAGSKQTHVFSKDDASSKFLCIGNINGNCKQDKCEQLHSDKHLPYLWQIKLCSWFTLPWFTLPNSESVEQMFCSPGKKNYSFKFPYACGHLECTIAFGPLNRASIRDNFFSDVEVRRLSTMSFNEAGDVGDSYVTQWRWYEKDDDGQFMLFEPDSLQHTLEAKFLAKQTTYLYWRENYKWMYKIDFAAMTQQNVQTAATRPLRRRPVFVSYKDVQDNITPPCLAPPQVIDIALPPSWVPWDVAHPFELIQLSHMETEFKKVSTNFFKTASRDKFTLTAVFRIQNHALLSAFCNHEKIMLNNQRRLGDSKPLNKRHLFHGTDSLDTVRGICVNNFDVRLCGKNGNMYGQGVYFARDAKYSHQFTRPDKEMERFMLQANVLVGHYAKGKSQYRWPPEKPEKDHELFDSCVDDEHNPSMFVLFDKNAYYPEYLIQYTDTSISTTRSRSKHFKSSNGSSVSNSVPPSSVLQAPPQTFRLPGSPVSMHVLNASSSMSSTAMPQTSPAPNTITSVWYPTPVPAHSNNQLSIQPSNATTSFIGSHLPSSQMNSVNSNRVVPFTAVSLTTPPPNYTVPILHCTPARSHSHNSLSLAPPNVIGSPCQPWQSMSMYASNYTNSFSNPLHALASNSAYSFSNPPPAHSTHTPPGYTFHAHN